MEGKIIPMLQGVVAIPTIRRVQTNHALTLRKHIRIILRKPHHAEIQIMSFSLQRGKTTDRIVQSLTARLRVIIQAAVTVVGGTVVVLREVVLHVVQDNLL